MPRKLAKVSTVVRVAKVGNRTGSVDRLRILYQRACRRAAAGLPITAILPALLLPLLLLSCGGFDTPPPHIVLITLDTTRPDRLGCYGYELASTPHIDRFAKAAVQFDNAVTPMASTLPAHTTILTGLTPLRHAVRANGVFQVSSESATLAERLRTAGYRTAAFVSCFVLDRKAGLAQGFDRYDDDYDVERRAHATTERAVAYLDSVGGEQPLFLWVHYFDPHQPLEPIEPYASTTRGDAYDAEISAMDASVGQLLAALDRNRISPRAHIIMLADHGESFGEHGYYDHGLLLYEDDCHIPFLWRAPESQEARRESTLVGAVDIFPTVLALTGAVEEGGHPAAEHEGLSLAGLLEGRPLDARSGVYMESMLPWICYRWSPLFAWRGERWKYIEAPTPELYDLEADPRETMNLAATRAGTLRAQAGRLEEYRAQWQGDEVGELRHLSDLEIEKLESLGYIAAEVPETRTAYQDLPNPADHVYFENELVRAVNLIKRKRWEPALEAWGEIAAAIPNSPLATLGLAQALTGLGRYEEALGWIDRHLSGSPDSEAGFIARGEALHGLGRYGEAVSAYDRVALGELSRRQLLHKVQSLLQLGRYPEARAIAVDRRDYALIFHQVEPWDTMIRAVERLERHGLTNPAPSNRAYEAQVQALIDIGLLPLAVALEAKDRGDHGPAAQAAVEGLLQAAAGHGSEALESFTLAETLGEDAPLIFLAHAGVLRREGRGAEAEAIVRHALATAPDQKGDVHLELARLLATSDRHEEALDVLRSGLQTGVLKGEGARDRVACDPELRPLHPYAAFRKLLESLAPPAQRTNR